jgi:cytochrome P450 / NADPH-cytochrome P450 reductase
MAFTLYLLLKHPDVLRKVRQEVDEVLGDEPAKVEDLSKLHYLNGERIPPL